MGQINTVDCNHEDLGLGTVSCEIFLSEFKTPILIKKGWSMTVTAFEALDMDGFVGLAQSGDWQPVLGSRQFTNNTPDPTTEEYSGGIISVIRNGKPQYQFDYDKGIGFHKALYSKNTFSQYNIGLVDDSGALVLALSADGTRVTGFEAGMVNTRTYMPKSGDTAANTPFEFQLINEIQFNKRMMVYSVEESGVDFNSELQPITSVTITGTNAAGDPIEVQVNASGNAGYGIEGLVAANFRVRNSATNAVVALTSVTDNGNGSYNLDPTVATVAAQTLIVETYDSDAEVNVTLVDTLTPIRLYKGESPVITVTA